MIDLGACPACGAGVGAHDAFCGGCGTPLTGAGGVPPVAASGPVPHRHIGPDAELWACQRCWTLACAPALCGCGQAMALVPAELRSRHDGTPMPYCTWCGGPLPEAFCGGCGTPAGADGRRVVPAQVASQLQGAAAYDGMFDVRVAERQPLAPGEVPIMAVHRKRTRTGEVRISAGCDMGGSRLVWRMPADTFVLTDRRVLVAAERRGLLPTGRRRAARAAARHGMRLSTGPDGAPLLERPLVEVVGHEWRSATPWSRMTLHFPGRAAWSAVRLEWKTGPGGVQTAAVGALLLAGSPMRATDHLAAHLGMEAFRSGLTTLSSDSLFGAVEQVAVHIRARRGGLPVLDG